MRIFFLLAVLSAPPISIWILHLRRAFRTGRWAASLILAYFLGLEYLLRSIQIVGSGQYGWDYATLRDVPDFGVFSTALVATSIAVTGIGVGVLTLSRESAHSTVRADILAIASPNSSKGGLRQRGGRTKALVQLAIAGILTSLLVFSTSQGGTVIDGSIGRQNFSSGLAYASGQIFVPIVIALMALDATGRTLITRRTTYLCVGLFSAAHLVFLGGRVEVVTLGLALLALATVTGSLRPSRVFLLLAAGTIALALYRINTREIFYSSAPSIGKADSTPLDFITRGDVSGFDKVLFLAEHDSVGIQSGETYTSGIRGLIPGLSGGDTGSRLFTSLADPERYEAGRTFEGASLLGEALLNFGYLGAVLVAICFGGLVGVVQARAHGPRGLFIWALLCGSLPSIVRADFGNILTTYVPMLLVGVASIHWYVNGRHRLHSRPPKATLR